MGIAFSYDVAADEELLLQSLSRTLTDLPVLCGRALKLQRTDTVDRIGSVCRPKSKRCGR